MSIQSGPDDDFYEKDGRKYYRVSRVLDIIGNQELAEWRGKVGNAEANKICREATKVGKVVHSLVEQQIRQPQAAPKMGKEPAPQVANCYAAFNRWMFERGLPQNAVVDFKTSGRVSWTYWLQLAAYWNLILEANLQPGTYQEVTMYSEAYGYAGTFDLACIEALSGLGLIIVRLDKDLAFYEQKVAHKSNLELFEGFLAALRLTKLKDEIEQEVGNG